MKYILLVLAILLSVFPIRGQCDGIPTDITFNVSECDSIDLQVLQDIINLNELTEWTLPIDGDDGDGIFEPQELGYQVWTDGRITSLNVGTYPSAGPIWYITPYGISALPHNFGELAMLQSLYLWFNNLAEIPQSIGAVTNLNILQLSANRLTALPDSIVFLDNLNHLVCSGNFLNSVPPGLNNLTNLVRLDIGANQFVNIPEELWSLGNLEDLDLSNNEITLIPDSIGLLTELSYLDLSYNNISELPVSISNLVNMNSIYLDSNYLYCAAGMVDTLVIPAFLTDGTIPNVYGLYNQRCDEIDMALSYFPIHIGDRWQYRVNSNYFFPDTTYYSITTVTGDTVMPNGLRYFKLDNFTEDLHRYFRIDTLDQAVYEYLYFPPSLFPDCEGHDILHLNLKPPSVAGSQDSFAVCLGYSVDYHEEYNRIGLLPDSADTYKYHWYFGINYWYDLAPGIGLSDWEEWEMSGYEGHLVYAEIDGVEYGEIVSTQPEIANVLHKFTLYPNHPNPFNPITTIEYELHQRSEVQLIIYNITGREVAQLVSETQSAGQKSIQWDATGQPSGVYFCRLMVGDQVQTRKMVVLK